MTSGKKIGKIQRGKKRDFWLNGKKKASAGGDLEIFQILVLEGEKWVKRKFSRVNKRAGFPCTFKLEKLLTDWVKELRGVGLRHASQWCIYIIILYIYKKKKNLGQGGSLWVAVQKNAFNRVRVQKLWINNFPFFFLF